MNRCDVNPGFRFRYTWLPVEEKRCPKANYLRYESLLWLQGDCEMYGALPQAGGVLKQSARLMQALRLIRSETRRIHTAQWDSELSDRYRKDASYGL